MSTIKGPSIRLELSRSARTRCQRRMLILTAAHIGPKPELPKSYNPGFFENKP